MAVTLPAEVLGRYRRFTLYNSPFAAHDRGRAVDLYPGDATHPDPVDGEPVVAPSPVAGEVTDIRTVTAPTKPYAAENDHLVLIDTAAGSGPAPDTENGRPPIARILHVDPAVSVGESVAIGDPLGRLVRAGFFAPWVANHLHLGFRARDANPYRAAGSIPLELDPALRLGAVQWDGTGTVVATGETYAVLDAPAHPDSGGAFAGIAATDGAGRVAGVLDGGLPHYDGGGLLGSDGRDFRGTDGGNHPETDDRDLRGTDSRPATEAVHLLDSRVGTATGRDVAWSDLTARANGDPVGGIALAPGRERLGVKLVGEAVDLPVGTDVTAEVSVDDQSPSGT